MHLKKATDSDIPALADLFWENLTAQPAYISHGELQMGIASGPGRIAADGKEKWKNYIYKKINTSSAFVQICRDESGGPIQGFIVAEIDSDGDKPFGVICDVVVRKEMRGEGLGKELLQTGIRWLREQKAHAVYLESGVENHEAHHFFERQGFVPVSHVFRLK